MARGLSEALLSLLPLMVEGKQEEEEGNPLPSRAVSVCNVRALKRNGGQQLKCLYILLMHRWRETAYPFNGFARL